MISYMLVNTLISPLSPLQKHRNFQHLPYKVKPQVSVPYYDVLLQYSLLVLALPDRCCEVRRRRRVSSAVCFRLLCCICMSALSLVPFWRRAQGKHWLVLGQNKNLLVSAVVTTVCVCILVFFSLLMLE